MKKNNKSISQNLDDRPLCDECNKPIPEYTNVPVGYKSPEIWKLDEVSVLGIGAMRPIQKTLCAPCYREAWKRRYPKEKLPI